MIKRLAGLAALAALAHAPGAAAGEIYLNSPLGPRRPPPPLLSPAPGSAASVELRVPGPIASRQHVDVGIGPDGAPLRVTATQRLTIQGLGDYSFLIPAPATRVVPGPGTESVPGLRVGGILWQGFSDGRRVLSATAALRPAAAAGALPLGVRIERRGASVIVHLVNLTRRRTRFQSGRATASSLRAALSRLRRFYRYPQTGRDVQSVQGRPTAIVGIDVAAPLRVTGVVSGGRSRLTVAEVLGARGPFEHSLVLRGSAAPRLRLRVEPLQTSEILPSPEDLTRARHPVITLQSSLDAIQSAYAFHHYLASPDRFGPSDATYVYRSVPKPVALARPTRRQHDSTTLTMVLGVVLGAAALTGLAALWAKS